MSNNAENYGWCPSEHYLSEKVSTQIKMVRRTKNDIKNKYGTMQHLIDLVCGMHCDEEYRHLLFKLAMSFDEEHNHN